MEKIIIDKKEAYEIAYKKFKNVIAIGEYSEVRKIRKNLKNILNLKVYNIYCKKLGYIKSIYDPDIEDYKEILDNEYYLNEIDKESSNPIYVLMFDENYLK